MTIVTIVIITLIVSVYLIQRNRPGNAVTIDIARENMRTLNGDNTK